MRKTMKGRRRKGWGSRRRSPQWFEAYKNFVAATVAYARHPETPDSVATPLLNALNRLRDRLNEADWIPKEMDV